MTNHNASNERIKRKYFTFLKQAKGRGESTIDAVAKALTRFELYTKHRDFKLFHVGQAVGFKRHLALQNAEASGSPLSIATLHATLMHLKRFFQWLAREPGYKSSLRYNEADYFSPSDSDRRIAKAARQQKVPTLEQIKHVINSMPAETELELRNRALIAFTLLTGARDRAVASLKLKHVDLIAMCVNQDAREVRTKNSKSFTTCFFRVGDEVRSVVMEWISYLREEKLWGNDDPLFPATLVEPGQNRQFEASGLDRRHWSTASPIRKIFADAFAKAGLPYFHPHSFRNTLVRLGEQVCKTPEEFKAWSQNLGHEKALTTFVSYGEVPSERQAEIIRSLETARNGSSSNAEDIEALMKIVRRFRDGK